MGEVRVEGSIELGLDSLGLFFEVIEALVHVVLLLLEGGVDDCCQLLGLLVGVGLQLLGLIVELFVEVSGLDTEGFGEVFFVRGLILEDAMKRELRI